MRLLWPNYVQALPAMSTLKFTPANELTQKTIIARGTEVLSQPIEGVQCQFKTCYDIEVYPISINSSSFTANGNGGIYQLRLELPSGVTLHSLNMKQLKIHFNGDKASCLSLIMALCSATTQAEFCALDENKEIINRSTFPIDSIQSVGFSADQALYDYPLNTFEGYRHIQEFFCYPEKYYYIDLTELPICPAQFSEGCKYIDIRFTIANITQQPFYANRITPELFCTPIVNSFKTDTQPILLTHRKELIAKAIHQFGNRRNEPYVVQNCASIPEHLLESELFGYQKGAFTGADRDYIGLIRSADKGVLFLDEIGDMPSSLQAKLLRVLDEKKVRPLGSTTLYDVDVKIISATHQALLKK